MKNKTTNRIKLGHETPIPKNTMINLTSKPDQSTQPETRGLEMPNPKPNTQSGNGGQNPKGNSK